jgi:hypothetical protein
MTRLIIVATSLLLLSGPGSPSTPVTFCDLLLTPDKYDRNHVTVRATWKYGFEWSRLYCLDCADKIKVWLEIPEDIDDSSGKALKRALSAGIVNVTVEGVFRGPGSFGHMSGYQYELIAEKVSNVAVVLKGLKGPDETTKAEKQWACGGTNPK